MQTRLTAAVAVAAAFAVATPAVAHASSGPMNQPRVASLKNIAPRQMHQRRPVAMAARRIRA